MTIDNHKDSGTAIVSDAELLALNIIRKAGELAETEALRHLLKKKGLPMTDTNPPAMLPGFTYRTLDDPENRRLLVIWKRKPQDGTHGD